MQDQRVEAAMARIARALERIEQVAADGAAEAGELARLRAAHDLLRRRVASAIGQIDDLLGAGTKASG